MVLEMLLIVCVVPITFLIADRLLILKVSYKKLNIAESIFLILIVAYIKFFENI